MNAVTIAQMTITEVNSTLLDIKTNDHLFNPLFSRVDPDPLMCEIDLELILPDLFKWYKLFHNDKVIDLVNHHITLQHRHTLNQLNSYDDDIGTLPEILEDIQQELFLEDELSEAGTDQED